MRPLPSFLSRSGILSGSGRDCARRDVAPKDPMITLTKIRELDLAQDSTRAGDARTPSHLSAASGLACAGSTIYVVADDELHLGVFDAAGHAPGHLLRLFEGELPMAKAARKRQKPDLEAIT